ncbi:hypothetical protein [Herbaspirillum lusitanum]|uniref:hypothetical protein n=1 Tax=Herbaspirillum lusitanum TaxID=213312 RepID=UPI0012F4C2F4|nr:hypothetical protein [Herbaspirillum lusitanum]
MVYAEEKFLFAKIQAIDITLTAICAQLSAIQASAALDLIQQITSHVAQIDAPNNRAAGVIELIPTELLRYQEVLLRQTSRTG